MDRPALLIALKDEFIKRKPRLIAGSLQAARTAGRQAEK